jgi:MFS transporter, DHA3 family, macrolide efflux protein
MASLYPRHTLLIPKQHLGRASGMVQMEQGIVQLLAPVLGGLLLEIIQLQGVVLLDMATCLFALVTPAERSLPESQRDSRWRARQGLCSVSC